jgi:UDP-glucose 6-dehydrogenase
MQKIGIIGYGIVGKAIGAYYENLNVPIVIFDKYCGINTIESIFETSITYICVPTPNNGINIRTSTETNISTETETETNISASINLTEVDNVFSSMHGYLGEIVLKSTVMPGTTDSYIDKYPDLNISFCPEFLSAKTNIYDYANQRNIILGKGRNKSKNNILEEWYSTMYPHAELHVVQCIEAESVKIFSNVFYAVKVQTFTEFYLACRYNGADFDIIRDLMLKNNWINPMHTQVPCNGRISFSGMCFPKDIASFNKYLEDNKLSNAVISAAMSESIRHNSESFP